MMSTIARLAAATMFAAATSSSAANYFVLSLMGDQLTLVSARNEVGSHLDQNIQQTLPQNDHALDYVALRAAQSALQKTESNAAITLLQADDSLYAARLTIADEGSAEALRLLDSIRKLVKPNEDARLVLISPYRSEPDLRTDRSHIGHGEVAGLGFYVDRRTRLRRSDTHELGYGFLAIFANLRVVLIDIATGRKLAEDTTRAGTTFSAARAEDKTPWDALSSKQKMINLERMVNTEVSRLLPVVLQKAAVQ